MRVLWISNTIFPEACIELGIKPQVKEGWTIASANALSDLNKDFELGVVSLYSGHELKIIDKYKYKYYLIPIWPDDQYYDSKKETFYKDVISDYNPDLVHIHGSEYPHSLSCAKVCKDVPFVVSIQGLVSECWKYLEGGLCEDDIKDKLTPKQAIKERIKRILGRPLRKTPKEEMQIRGIYEKNLFELSKNVIGRTSWDKSAIWKINPNANYYFCNETLRSAFYRKQWDFDSCERYSIFISQGNYPLKGLHKVLEALPIVIRSFPETKLYIGGHDILKNPIYANNGYARYIKKLIAELGIERHVSFLGFLDEEQMAERYARSHVFVSSSSIENSPNSVGEAQLVGTPCIGSYVGGTMDMIEDGKTGLLYRFEESTMLTYKICQLFGSPIFCKTMSLSERETAQRRHDKNTNAINLKNIYETIYHNYKLQ